MGNKIVRREVADSITTCDLCGEEIGFSPTRCYVCRRECCFKCQQLFFHKTRTPQYLEMPIHVCRKCRDYKGFVDGIQDALERANAVIADHMANWLKAVKGEAAR